MTLIHERDIIRKIPVFVTKGRNAGKQTGWIYFEKNKAPYYYIQKSYRSSQIMQHPKHRGKLPVSTSILNTLKEHGVANIVFMIVGYDDAGTFYIVVPAKDYENAPVEEWDDAQAFVWMQDYTRIYPEQGSLKKFIGI